MARAEIYSHTSASSNTGGNAVGPGGVVKTGGASASVSATNAHGTSTSSVYIKTDANGVVHEESYDSASGDVSVSVQSTPKETVIETREGAAPAVKKTVPAPSRPAPADTETRAGAQGEAEPAAPIVPAPAASSAAAAETSPGLGAFLARSIQSLITALFSWFA
jgi:hypothetical protein